MILDSIKGVYEKHYKKLFIIPIILIVFALVQIGVQTASTGSFLIKDISLKGGTTLTVFYEETLPITEISAHLQSKFPNSEFSVRSLDEQGVQIGFIVDTSLTDEAVNHLIPAVEELTGELGEDQFNTDIIGSSLGQSFFQQTLIALLIAFVLMGLVVFLYFKVPIPSLAVILSAFSDIVVTLAIVNLFGMKISTAGIAAFLMLIGYSVDTDILLSTHVLKRRDVKVINRIYRAMMTGFMTTGTTLVAVILALIFSKSDVIIEIMTIVLIGLMVDTVNTWILNSGILRMYMEKKYGKDS